LAQSHPRSQVEGDEHRDDRAHRRECQRRIEQLDSRGYGENLARDHDIAQQEQASQIGHSVDRIHDGLRIEGKTGFYSIAVYFPRFPRSAIFADLLLAILLACSGVRCMRESGVPVQMRIRQDSKGHG
jgi:hypothetical protein